MFTVGARCCSADVFYAELKELCCNQFIQVIFTFLLYFLFKEMCPYVSSCGYLKYTLVACGIGLSKLHVHNWGVVNSFVWYNSVVASGFSGVRGESKPLAS